MNYENIGKVVGKVINKNDRKKDKIISISDKTADLENPMNKIVLNKSFETIQQIPNKQQERQILYITGASGSGKSYYTQLYCSEYKKLYPKNEIYLFSSINEDSSIDKIKGLQRFILDDAFLKEEITAEDFKNSMVIFDDTDVISNKALKFKINSILNILLETGRHFNASVIYTSHIATAGIDTKRILNEAHSITIFPSSLGGRSLKYLLDNYLGFDKEQIKKVKKLDSRWTTICKTFPMVILSEKEAYLLKNDD
jgi:hypothetical protein